MSFLEQMKAITKKKQQEQTDLIKSCKNHLFNMLNIQIEYQAYKGFSSLWFNFRDLPDYVATYNNTIVTEMVKKGTNPPFSFEVYSSHLSTQDKRDITTVTKELYEKEGFQVKERNGLIGIRW